MGKVVNIFLSIEFIYFCSDFLLKLNLFIFLRICFKKGFWVCWVVEKRIDKILELKKIFFLICNFLFEMVLVDNLYIFFLFLGILNELLCIYLLLKFMIINLFFFFSNGNDCLNSLKYNLWSVFDLLLLVFLKILICDVKKEFIGKLILICLFKFFLILIVWFLLKWLKLFI